MLKNSDNDYAKKIFAKYTTSYVESGNATPKEQRIYGIVGWWDYNDAGNLRKTIRKFLDDYNDAPEAYLLMLLSLSEKEGVEEECQYASNVLRFAVSERELFLRAVYYELRKSVDSEISTTASWVKGRLEKKLSTKVAQMNPSKRSTYYMDAIRSLENYIEDMENSKPVIMLMKEIVDEDKALALDMADVMDHVAERYEGFQSLLMDCRKAMEEL
jgi:hypothetical protein